MRPPWSAKQHLWLGPGRYRRRRRNAFANGNSYPYGNSHRYTHGMRAGNSNTYGYIDAAVVNSNGDTDRHARTVQLVGRAEHAYGFD